MLSYALAIAIAFSSLVLFFTAFVMSDIHRKDDFLWSGVGLFYALVLWFCARNITGAVLLGQGAVSILVLSFVWQTLKLRKAIANPERSVAISNFSILQAVNGLLKGKKSRPQGIETTTPSDSPDVVTESKIAIPKTTSTEVTTSTTDSKSIKQKKSKFASLGNFFSKKKKSTITNTKLDDILEDKKATTTTTTTTKKIKEISKDEVNSKNEAVEKIEESLEKSEEKIEKNQPQDTENKVENTEVTENKEVVSPVAVTQEEVKLIENEKIENQEADIPNPKKSVEEVEAVEKLEETKKITESTENNIPDNSDNKTEVTQEENNQEVDNTTVETIEETKKITELTENNILDNPDKKTEVIQEENNQEVDNTTIETAEETQLIEQKQDPSSLDSLETVEVAEVLDAVPDSSNNQIDADNSNIIEVKTTDINEANDLKQQNKDVNPE